MTSPSRGIKLGEWSDFHGGEYGTLGGRRAPEGSFSAINLVVYKDGGLGPRAGLRRITPSGLPNGRIWAGGTRPKQNVAWILTEDANPGTSLEVYELDLSTDTPVASALTNLDGTLAGVLPPAEGVGHTQLDRDNSAFCVRGEGIWRIDHDAGDVVQLTTTPGPLQIARYGDRLVAGNTPASSGRLYYSEVNDFASWPATNFLDIGNLQEGISALVPLRESLFITKNDGGRWRLSGVPGVNDTLRSFIDPERFVGAVGGALANQMGHGIRFTLAHGREIAGIPEWGAHPETYDGSQRVILAHLSMGSFGEVIGRSTNPKMGASPILEDSEVVLVAGQKDGTFAGTVKVAGALMYRNGAWTYHELPLVEPETSLDAVTIWPHPGQFGALLFVSQTETGGTYTPRIHQYHAALDKVPEYPADLPGGSGSLLLETSHLDGDPAAGGNGVTGQVAFHEIYDANGRYMKPRTVELFFEGYQQSPGTTPIADLNVDVELHYHDVDQGADAVASGLGIASADPVTDGYTGRQHRTFSFEGRYCRGFHVELKNLRGMRVDRVEVYGDTSPERRP